MTIKQVVSLRVFLIVFHREYIWARPAAWRLTACALTASILHRAFFGV